MDKITAAGLQVTQQTLLARMQQTAALASAGAISPQPSVMPAGGVSAGNVSFAQAMKGAIDNVDALQHSASTRQKAIEMGQSDDLAGAMIESQKASVAFSAMVQVRNKLTTALDEVMNIPL